MAIQRARGACVPESVQDWFRRSMRKAGLNKHQLHKKSGVARPTIDRVEKGLLTDDSTLARLAKEMGTAPPIVERVIGGVQSDGPETALGLVRGARRSLEQAERLLATSADAAKGEPVGPAVRTLVHHVEKPKKARRHRPPA